MYTVPAERAQNQNAPTILASETSVDLQDATDPLQKLRQTTWTENTLFEDFLDDSALNSMFNKDGFEDTDARTRIDDGSLSSTSAFTSTSSSSSDQTDSDIIPNLTSSTPVLLNAPIPTQAPPNLPISTINNRFNCTQPNCGADFARIGDLRRHHRVHGSPNYARSVSGCARRGGNAFYRRDKLLDHMRKKHGMTV